MLTCIALILAAIVCVRSPALPNAALCDMIGGIRQSLQSTLTVLPQEPALRARAILHQTPVIGQHAGRSSTQGFRSDFPACACSIAQTYTDGHIDLPILTRVAFRNQPDKIDLKSRSFPGHVTIPLLRKGSVGGFFWSVYVPCPEDAGYERDNLGNFSTPSFRVRDTLEQIDIARLLADKYSETFELVQTESQWKHAVRRGKIAAMLGVEGWVANLAQRAQRTNS